MVKLQENPKTKQKMFTIPKSIASAKNWNKGTELGLKFNKKGELLIIEE